MKKNKKNHQETLCEEKRLDKEDNPCWCRTHTN